MWSKKEEVSDGRRGVVNFLPDGGTLQNPQENLAYRMMMVEINISVNVDPIFHLT